MVATVLHNVSLTRRAGLIWIVQVKAGMFVGVRRITAGEVSTLAGGSTTMPVDGVGTMARFSNPSGIVVDEVNQAVFVAVRRGANVSEM